MTELNKNIGKRIRDVRKSKNISIENMAEKLNISYSTYQRIESGETTSWATHLENISEILEIPFEEIIIEKGKLKQVNKDNATGYLAENQTFILSEKLIEQYEIRLKEKDEIINGLRNK